MRPPFFAALFAFVLFALPSAAPAYDFAGETLTYEFGWNGIAAADATVKIRKGNCSEPCLAANLTVTGRKYLDLVWKIRDRIEITCFKDTYLPRTYTFFQREGRFNLDTEIWIDQKNGLLRSKRYRVDKKKRYRDKSVSMENTFGPVSSILYMRSRPLKVGDRETILAFDGKRSHQVEWQVLAKEKIKIGMGEFNALKIRPRITKSSSKDKKSNVEKVKKVTVWVTDDPAHIILKIESQAFVGHIYGELTSK